MGTAKRVSKCGRLLGLQPNSSSVAKRWEGAAPQLSLRPLPPLLHPHHFPQHPAHSAADSTTGDDSSATHQPSSTYWTCGSIQLRRWFRKLASRLVSGQEGVVLQSPRQGLSEPSRWMCDVYQAI